MKAAFLTEKGFVLRDVPMPTCGPRDLLIKTVACGVCEGDVFRYKTRASLGNGETLLGHEGTGLVHAVGAAVTGFAVGDAVTTLNGNGYAEFYVTGADRAVKIPAPLPPAQVLGEPMACFVHASGRFGIQPGDRVAMIGCGYMGVGCLEMAKLEGALETVAIEPLAWRRDQAAKLGATKVYNSEGKTPEAVLADLGLFDVVIEATGVAPVVDLATALVKEHGRIVFVGYHQSDDGKRTVNMKMWNYKAIDVVNGHVRRTDEKMKAMERSVRLLASGALRFDGAMIAEYPLERVEDAFRDLLARKPGLYKAVLRFAA